MNNLNFQGKIWCYGTVNLAMKMPGICPFFCTPVFIETCFFYGPAAGGRTAIWSGRVNKHKNITDQWRLEYLITFMKFMSVILENNYEWLIRMTFSCESLSFSLPIKDQRFDRFFRPAGGSYAFRTVTVRQELKVSKSSKSSSKFHAPWYREWYRLPCS